MFIPYPIASEEHHSDKTEDVEASDDDDVDGHSWGFQVEFPDNQPRNEGA